ncbi:MAG: hypothetical protein ACAI44_17235, partial [Candidatus Sericytochromatia bacterium]
PLELKPLSDLLILNGDLTQAQQQQLFPNASEPAAEPLWHLLEKHDFSRTQLQESLEQGPDQQNLAVRLVKSGLISHSRLNNLILHTHWARMPAVKIQGEAVPSLPTISQIRQDQHIPHIQQS